MEPSIERTLVRLLDDFVRQEELIATERGAIVEELGFTRKRASDVDVWDVVWTGQDHEYATVVSTEKRVPPDSGEPVVLVDFLVDDDDLTKTFQRTFFYEDFVNVKVPIPQEAF